MAEPENRRNVLFYLAAEGVIPVVGGCAGALAGGPSGGIAGVALGHAVEKAINLFGRGIVERWRGWFASNPAAATGAVAALAALPAAEARTAAKSIILELAPTAAEPDVALAVEFLTAIPAAVDRALVPDPTGGGRSLSPAVAFDDPRSLLQLLPEDVPPYPATATLPGTPYQLVELLGTGGFGAVYRAVSPTLQHLPLAIKFCLDRSLLPTLNQERSNLERLMRAGGRGSGHVVRLYGYDLDHPTPYLVYEYVAGGDLTKLLAARRAAGRAPGPGEVLGWVTQITDGLAFAHRTGLVHRDLKPANVLAEEEWAATSQTGPSGSDSAVRLKLADFGLGGVAVARVVARSRIGATTFDFLSLADQASLFRGAGTPLYMSPEQRRGASPDPRHDLYALGVVWYQLLTGDVSRELHHGWAKELAVRYGVPPPHIALIERCVGWFDERPKNADELLPLLEAAAGQPVSPVPVTVGEPEPALPTSSAETVVGTSQVTPVPKPPPNSDTGRGRGAAAMIARLDGVYAELGEMKNWRFNVTALYGFAVGLLVGWGVGELVYSVRHETAAFPKIFSGDGPNDWTANLLGFFAGLFVWAAYVWLIRSGVQAVAADVQKRADGLIEELANHYLAEVAAWGGRPALQHPGTVRQIRRELAPAAPAPASSTSGLTQDDLAANPTRRALVVARLHDLDQTLDSSSDGVTGSWLGLAGLWGLGMPAVVSLAVLILGGYRSEHGDPGADHIPPSGYSKIAIIAGAGAVGVACTWLSWWAMAALRRHCRAKAIASVDRFTADYPKLVADWGGRGMLESRETVAALIRAIDPTDRSSKLGGFFGRLFGR